MKETPEKHEIDEMLETDSIQYFEILRQEISIMDDDNEQISIQPGFQWFNRQQALNHFWSKFLDIAKDAEVTIRPAPGHRLRAFLPNTASGYRYLSNEEEVTGMLNLFPENRPYAAHLISSNNHEKVWLPMMRDVNSKRTFVPIDFQIVSIKQSQEG